MRLRRRSNSYRRRARAGLDPDSGDRATELDPSRPKQVEDERKHRAIHRDPGWSHRWFTRSGRPAARFQPRDRRPRCNARPRRRSEEARQRCGPESRGSCALTSPTTLIPTDGIVKSTADKITASTDSDLAKARAIYEWIVDNTFRNPKTPGCGLGNIQTMLVTGDLGGKCADINALYVGLARSHGPARAGPLRDTRRAVGLRIQSLGANTPDVTHAQHCRAEVFLTASVGCGRPGDVRKVVLEEPRVIWRSTTRWSPTPGPRLRRWESNWVATTTARCPAAGLQASRAWLPHVSAGRSRRNVSIASPPTTSATPLPHTK